MHNTQKKNRRRRGNANGSRRYRACLKMFPEPGRRDYPGAPPNTGNFFVLWNLT